MKVIPTVSLVLLGATSTACAASEPERIEHYIVFSTQAVEKLPVDETGNLSPWRDAKPVSQPLDEDGIEEIVFSNSCGFAEYTYAAIRLDEYPGYFNMRSSKNEWSVIKARGQLGEWCRLEPFLFEKTTLVTIGYMKDIAYVYRHSDIHWDGKNNEYIGEYEGISENGWSDKLNTIDDPSKSSSCVDRNTALPRVISWFSAQPNVENYGSQYCYSMGVYLRDLSSAWRPPNGLKQ